jgi:hypothetical protein
MLTCDRKRAGVGMITRCLFARFRGLGGFVGRTAHHQTMDRPSTTQTVLIDRIARASPWGNLTLGKSNGRPGSRANSCALLIHPVCGRGRFRNTTLDKTSRDDRCGTDTTRVGPGGKETMTRVD